MDLHPKAFQNQLLEWYDRGHRELPWRRVGAGGRPNPWHILVSEFMLQQTRVEAVIPYFQEFLAQFPDPRSLVAAHEPKALAVWSGLGYYSRIRNLRRAAQMMADGFPTSYEAIRALPGVGPYTAAAVASIGFNLPHAVADGNVFRVLARFTGDAGDIGSQITRQRLTDVAQSLLYPTRPGDFNQAMMELGATLCLPRSPQCLLCPISADCKARQENLQDQLPVKRRKAAPERATLDLMVVERNGRILLSQRSPEERRMAGFWELPARDSLSEAAAERVIGEFVHTIVNTRYEVRVWSGSVAHKPRRMQWFPLDRLEPIPLTTASRKALALVYPLRAIAAKA